MRVATTVAMCLALGLLVLAGCDDMKGRKTSARDDCKPEKTKSCYMNVPSDSCKVLKVTKSYPSECVVGQPFATNIEVCNVSDEVVHDVTLYETDSGNNFRCTGCEPESESATGGRRVWNLGSLAPDECRTVCINGSAMQSGTVCATVGVTFRPREVRMTINAIQPALTLEQCAPACQLVCDPIPMKFVVKNVGTGQACNVVVCSQLPEGWETADGQKTLSYNAGTLDSGEQREFEACVRAAQTGLFQTQSVATADNGLRAVAEGSTQLVKPELSVTIAGPEERYIDVPYAQTITVMNGPTVKADNSVLVYTLPPGSVFVSASDNGAFSAGRVTWDLGTISCRESRKVSVQLRGCQIGVNRSTASVTASCGNAQGAAQINIMGIGALLLEMVDLCDPVEVGQNTTYRITVTNQGSSEDTNIQISAFLPDAMSYVSSTGATNASADGKKLTFAKLSRLAPGGKATWDVVVKAEQACNCRFEVRMTSDQVGTSQPVVETEATHLFK